MPKNKFQTEYFSGRELSKKRRSFKISLKLVALLLFLIIIIALAIFAFSSKIKKLQVIGSNKELNLQVQEYLKKYESVNYFFAFSSSVELDLAKQFEGIATVQIDKKFPDILVATVTKREVIAKIICQNYSALLGSDLELTNIVEQPNFSLGNNLINALKDTLNFDNLEITLPSELTNSATSNSTASQNNIGTSTSFSSLNGSTSSETVESKIQKFKAQEILKIRRSMYFDFFDELKKLNLTNSSLDQELPTVYCFENLTKLDKFKSLLIPSTEILQTNDSLIIKNNDKIYIYSLLENLEIQELRLSTVKTQIEKEKLDFSQIDLRENKVVVY